MKKLMNEGKPSTEVVRNTTRNRRGKTDKFTAVQVPTQCPLVFLVTVGWREGKAFGSGESRKIKIGVKTEVEKGHTPFDRNFDIKILKVAFDDWGLTNKKTQLINITKIN
jgi:hypothetical protein